MSIRKKVAIIYTESITDEALGSTRTLMDLAKLLSSKYDVRAFSLGRKHRRIIKDNIQEEVFSSKASTDSRNTKIRILDYVNLFFMKKQLSYNIMNQNKVFIKSIISYKPDIIITLGRVLVDAGILLKKNLKDSIIFSITDDIRVVDNAIKIRHERFMNSKSRFKSLKRPLFEITSKRLGEFSREIYKKMLDNFDGIAFVTEIDKNLSEKSYPNHKSKFFVLPTASFPQSSILKKPVYKVNKVIKTILFIGNCKHEPNIEAMLLIENKIAPFLKDKKFIIIGSNCEKRIKENVEYTGFISDERKIALLDKADLCIAPLKNGSGIKVKILEYFARCKPVIGTSVAFEGYNIKNKENAVLENNIDNYPKLILELEKDIQLREHISNNSNTVCEYFSYGAVEERWSSAIKELESIKNKNNTK
ncbi:MAG: glycosyltransferase family 4 protein [Candidatus Micrarchaeia archaeon]